MQFLAVIPARYASSRFPGKPLVDIGGKSMIQRVYEQVSKVENLKVVVATDDQRIYDHVTGFGGSAEMTSDQHPTGTDRCAEVALRYPDVQYILNIQGDEPFVDPSQISTLMETVSQAGVDIGTLVSPLTKPELLDNPNAVKAVVSRGGRCIYFSRFPVPFLRNKPREEWLQQNIHYKHIGLYAYSAQVLKEISALPPGLIEVAESLEQLRWLEAGYSIVAGLTDLETPAVDTPEDLEKILKERKF